jgi:hypothetical protein
MRGYPFMQPCAAPSSCGYSRILPPLPFSRRPAALAAASTKTLRLSATRTAREGLCGTWHLTFTKRALMYCQ